MKFDWCKGIGWSIILNIIFLHFDWWEVPLVMLGIILIVDFERKDAQ